MGRDALLIPVSTWVEDGLKDGLALTESDVARLERAAAVQRWTTVAARYLGPRPRTEWELVRYLTRKQVPSDVIDGVVATCRERGWVDDVAYARAYLRTAKRTASRREVTWKLARRGLPSSEVQSAVRGEMTEDDEQAAALYAAEKFLRSHRGLEPDLAARKLLMHLRRKGFGSALCLQVLARSGLKSESIAHVDVLDND